MRVLFYVQNLLGIGHIVRALRISKAIVARGGTVELALGGVPVSGLNADGVGVTQLVPIRAGDGGFSDLVLADGSPVGADVKAARTRGLLEALTRVRPDVVLIEAYPFGRRQMRFELRPFIEAARAQQPRPMIVSSVRDILQENRAPGRTEEIARIVRTNFDHVVVHGDPRVATLSMTFSAAAEIADITAYSGIVAPEPSLPAMSAEARQAVIVSAGGGAVGRNVLRAALLAKPATVYARAPWLAVTGPNMPPADAAEIDAIARSNGVELVRFVSDLPQRLAEAALSISQAGYNTVADILVAGCRAVLVPFAADGETEQTRRTAALEDLGLAVGIGEHALTPQSMAAAITRAATLVPAPHAIALDGARKTAIILEQLLARFRT